LRRLAVLLLLLLLLAVFVLSLLQALVDFVVYGGAAPVVLQRHLQGTCGGTQETGQPHDNSGGGQRVTAEVVAAAAP
jgi:hypothetical protein